MNMKSTNMIPPLTKLLWGAGAGGVALLLNVVAAWAMFYMTLVLKIDPFNAGMILFFPKIFDALTDPLIGTISDRLKTNKSRRRPFLLIGAILSPLAFLMIFTTPLFEVQWMRGAYIFTALMIYSLAMTIFNIPYLAMPAEMTDEYNERTSIHGARVIFFRVAGILALAVPLLIGVFGGMNSWNAYAAIGVLGAISIFVFMITAWIGTSKARFTAAPEKHPNFFKEIRHVFSNSHFLRLIGVKFCQLVGVASTIAAFVFFIQFVLGRELTFFTIYGGISAVVGILAIPVFLALSKKIGKSKTYIVSAVFYIIAVLSWVFVSPDDSLFVHSLRAVPIGIAATGNVILAMSMLTDIVNYDSHISGVRREGVFTAFYTFTEKLTFAFGPLIVGAALKLAGFDADLPTEKLQTPEIRQALLFGMAYIPAIFGIISIILLAGYKLTEADIRDAEYASETLG